ncbi:MAG TPA: peptide chain release factor N(5)-glutamine methyltransferase [Crinalium sp.]
MGKISGQDLWQWRSRAREQAVAAAISPDEVDWLLQEIAGLDRLALRLSTFKNQPELDVTRSLDELDRLWQRRLETRAPVQYLAGTTPWRQFLLAVSPAVLIPRPETECLIDLVVNAIASGHSTLAEGHWADLGTGSGAIAIALADALPRAIIHAVDRSEAALAIARLNAQRLGLGDRIEFHLGSWFEPLAHFKGQLSGMVSNPPYIPHGLIPTLQPEVAQHEPHLALDGGTDGLDAIRDLVAIAPTYLKPGGLWLIEMMAGQADTVADLLQQHGCYRDISIHTDLAGIERFALAFRAV